MECYLFLTFAIGGSYPRPKGRELATTHLSKTRLPNHSWIILKYPLCI